MRLLPLFGLLVIVVAVVVAAMALRRPSQRSEATVAEARRHAGRISLVALVAGVVAALGAGYTANLSWITGEALAGRAGVALISMPLAFGLAHTGTVLVGELTWPKPAGDVRRARLVRRGLLDSVPRWLLRLALATLAAGLLIVVAGALLSGPDGRTVTVTAADGQLSGAAAPFAGVDYGGPTAAGLVFLAALTFAALWVVAERPALGTADERAEAVLRRASAHRVLRGATTAALVAVGGLLTVSGLSIRNAAMSVVETGSVNGVAVGAAVGALPWIGGFLAVLGFLAILAGVGLFTARAPRRPADAPLPTGH
ncbi:hypothetical protein O2V63_13460 [Modestobacter sp. VKM Ac-2977]|uniref:hypothetical protein n=1 Tax=Modestobacter sp. VKM Ac-2977 TaxID=3004131 RepID=UPI0022AA30A2|nr:hypothetical protein [Modestobacter sp. VKM Ac-2977]MCZ2821347.1 hypothetical protein [Modestobacter sp. VKM Ac-2977]